MRLAAQIAPSPRSKTGANMAKDQASAVESLWFLNGRVTILRSATAAPERVAIIEQLLPEGDSPPLHLHAHEDEVFHILEGVVRFRLGGTEVTAQAGETLVGPKGVPHGFRVESAHARLLTFTVGGDFEGMVREMSRPAGDGLPPAAAPSPELIEALTAACARHQIEIVGPPLSA
jgi:quercetin dioxygenase-like cupin family protein